jgi:Tol biopolymer transport system component
MVFAILALLGGTAALGQTPDVALLVRNGSLDDNRAHTSADGRFVVVESSVANLVPGQIDTNGGSDIFLVDRVAGTVTLVSHVPGAPTTAGDGDSDRPAISADGAFVVFHSRAANLVGAPGLDTNGERDVFLYERATGTVTLVSHVPGAPTTSGNEESVEPVISADGAYVAFQSRATDLVGAPGLDPNGNANDIFLYERATGAVILLSHLPGAPTTTGNATSDFPAISADGAFVVFQSNATDLVGAPGLDTNGDPDSFLYERATGTVTLVSRVPGNPNAPGSSGTGAPVISADGAYVAFQSQALDLVGGSFGLPNIFLYERATGTVTLVSHAPGAPPFQTPGNGSSSSMAISADGSFVAFLSNATDLVGAPGLDTNGNNDVFLYERATGTVTLLSHVPGAPTTTGNSTSTSGSPVISADGAFVVFRSAATNLVSGGSDTNSGPDIFRFERATGLVTLVSHVVGAPTVAGNGGSDSRQISADGTVIVFSSVASDLVANDPNGATQDLFVLANPVAAGATLSKGVGGVPSDGASGAPRISANGRYVVFSSRATNLVTAPGCVTGVPQVFRLDRFTGLLQCVSQTLAGAPGDGPSGDPVVSADGRFVAYPTRATNLVAGCANGQDQIVLTDMQTRQTLCVSQGAAGPGAAASRTPTISGDGNLIAFVTPSANLDPACANGVDQVQLRNVAAGTIRCVSVDAGGQAGTGPSVDPALSGDGSRLVYATKATNLLFPAAALAAAPAGRVAGGQPRAQSERLAQIVRQSTAVGAGVAELLSRGPGGAPGNGESRLPAVSDDGGTVAFESTATNLVSECATGVSQVLVTGPGGMSCASRNEDGAQGDAPSTAPAISGAGTVVVWVSLARNLTRGLTGPADVSQILRRNLQAQNAVVELMSQAGGTAGNGASQRPSIDRSGQLTVFQTAASNLASGDTNGQDDVLLVAVAFAPPAAPTRVTITSPTNGSAFPLTGPTLLTVTWTEQDGADSYGLEFTGADRVFANPNGTTPDGINGFLGAGGAVLVQGTTFSATLDATFPAGLYQLRVVGLTQDLQLIGRFSDAVTLVLGAVPPGDGRVVITQRPGGSVLTPGTPVTFVWGALPNVTSYFFEFTGPGGQFANPNGTGPDPGNTGGGGLIVTSTGFAATVPALSPGVYQVRVIGRTASGAFVGTFSDAVSLTIQ